MQTISQLVVRGPNGEQVVVHDMLSIGRDPRNGLVIDLPGVSRQHAVLLSSSGGMAIRDLASSNGTFVNERRAEGITPLAPGDLIRIGEARLSVESIPRSVPGASPRRSARTRPAPALLATLAAGVVFAAIFAGALLTSTASGGAASQESVVAPTPGLQQDWAGVFARVSPDVVLIANQPGQRSGTGFLFDARHVVTNAHVVHGAASVDVSFPPRSGQAQASAGTATVLARDESLDVAVLALPGSVEHHLEFGSVRNLHVGDEVMAIGDPVGLAWTATFGRVSALRSGRDLQVPETTVVQFDAAVNPGNSGGPLIDRDGRAIGIVTAKVNNAQGLGFAMGGDDIWTRCTAWIAAAAN